MSISHILYYGIGCYVSKNSRERFWGKGAIDTIIQQQQKELPGLRGFSATNIRNNQSLQNSPLETGNTCKIIH